MVGEQDDHAEWCRGDGLQVGAFCDKVEGFIGFDSLCLFDAGLEGGRDALVVLAVLLLLQFDAEWILLESLQQHELVHVCVE